MLVSVVFGVVALLVGFRCPASTDAAAIAPLATTLKVGAFNIKSFGRTKMSKTVVAEHIKKIVERYDVLLIQEIRDKSVESVRRLRSMLDPPFKFVISDPIGRSSYKEQYAYFYRTDRVRVLDTYQYEDPDDVFEREPFVAKIAPVAAIHDNMTSVSLIGLHSRPSDATAEIGHLEEVIARTLEKMGTDSEPIVLGDLNADCKYGNLRKRLEAGDYLTTTNTTYKWLIDDDADTTTKKRTNCAYDRIIVRTQLQSHVVNNTAVVFNYADWLGLNEDKALDVSDHYPVEMTLQF